MKTGLLIALVGLAIGFALPTIAQQTNTPDPKLSEALAALNKKVDDGFVNGDAATLTALYTEDAVIVSHDVGPIYGREAIEKHFVDIFKNLHFSKHMSKQEQYSPHVIGTAGNELWSTGEFDQTFQVGNDSPLQISGHFLDILVREGNALKINVDTYNFTGPPVPAAPAQTNAVPSAQEQSKVDPQLRQQIEPLMIKFQEAYNNRDAATIGALLTQDAIEVRSWPAEYRGGLASGREALQKRFEADFATNPGKMANKLVQLYPIGSAICEITNSDVGGWKAQTVTIWVREGDTWKSSMTYVNNQPNVADPQVRQQIEALFMRFQEAYNSRDTATIAAIHTPDAIEVRSWQGLASGRQAIAKRFEPDFVENGGKMVNKLVQLYPIGNAICEIADTDVGEWKGQTATIYVRDGHTWKVSIRYVNDQR